MKLKSGLLSPLQYTIGNQKGSDSDCARHKHIKWKRASRWTEHGSFLWTSWTEEWGHFCGDKTRFGLISTTFRTSVWALLVPLELELGCTDLAWSPPSPRRSDCSCRSTVLCYLPNSQLGSFQTWRWRQNILFVTTNLTAHRNKPEDNCPLRLVNFTPHPLEGDL